MRSTVILKDKDRNGESIGVREEDRGRLISTQRSSRGSSTLIAMTEGGNAYTE